MENIVKVRACFTGCNIKSGKTVMQFELDPEHKGALPQLAIMTGTFADDDEDEDGSYQLPPAAYEYEDIQDEAA